ncbi:MAG TPA: lamin tail domain-containing protein, partial [Thermoguttaceae bacterium]|nr:lamin tail domain-containing protein [Thermoguttaceae bacterium]
MGPSPTRKWSFKVYFRDDYDEESWLNYPLIETTSVDRFKSLVLRSGYNDSSNPFIKDELGRRLHKDMGHVVSNGTFANVFVNGQLKNNGYYNPAERISDRMFQEKLGSELPWDVVSKWQPSGTPADPPRSHNEPYYFDVRDGNAANFAEMLDYALANDLSQAEHYEEMARRLNIAQFIDYLIIEGYARISDWPHNNWNAAREQSDGELGKWQFYAWDLELGWGSSQLTGDFKTPGGGSDVPINILYDNLRHNDDFLQLFADRAQAVFFNGGALTAGNVIERFEQLRAEMIGVLPNMNTYIRDTWASARPGVVLGSMVSKGLFTFEGPRLLINGTPLYGGEIVAGDAFTLTNPNTSGTIYYTLDGTDPRESGGGLLPEAIPYDGTPILLGNSSLIKARVLDAGEWSGLSEAEFLLQRAATAGDLVITELNYNPLDPTTEELAVDPEFNNDDFEFIELRNVSNETVELAGVQFTGGVTLTIDGLNHLLAPGERTVVLSNQTAFEARYGTSVAVVGVYTDGSLSNGGEEITVLDRLGETIIEFTYDDSDAWPGRADGNGSSLELLDPNGDYNDGANWRSSSEVGGSPGYEGVGPLHEIVINEVLSHTDAPALDAIELYNPTDQEFNIGGWYLSDSSGQYRKFRIPDNTVISAGAYRVFDESDFNPSGGIDPLLHPNDFALNAAHGDDVWLLKTDATDRLTHFVDHVDFPAAARDETLGRWPNGQGDFYPMRDNTLGRA